MAIRSHTLYIVHVGSCRIMTRNSHRIYFAHSCKNFYIILAHDYYRIPQLDSPLTITILFCATCLYVCVYQKETLYNWIAVTRHLQFLCQFERALNLPNVYIRLNSLQFQIEFKINIKNYHSQWLIREKQTKMDLTKPNNQGWNLPVCPSPHSFQFCLPRADVYLS